MLHVFVHKYIIVHYQADEFKKCDLTPTKKSSSRSNIPTPTSGPFRDIYVETSLRKREKIFISSINLNF